MPRMTTPHFDPSGIRAPLGRLLRDQRGVAEVLEYALVAMPFVAMIFVLIETNLLTYQAALLGGGMELAARLILTGQAQDSAQAAVYTPPGGQAYPDYEAFLAAIYANPKWNYFAGLTQAKIYISVYKIANFDAGKTLAPLVVDDAGNCTNCQFITGGGSTVVAFQIGYLWTPITPGLNSLLGATGANLSQLLQFQTVFQNEPFAP